MRNATVVDSGGSIRPGEQRLADGAEEDGEDRDPDLRASR